MALQMLKKIFWCAAITFCMYEHRRNLGGQEGPGKRALSQKKFSASDFFFYYWVEEGQIKKLG